MRRKCIALALTIAMALTLFPIATQAAELPKLPTPTELKWGINRNGTSYEEEIPGYVNWSTTGGSKSCMIQYYNVKDETTPVFKMGEGNPYGSSSWFRDISSELESGTYYFTVQWRGDGVSYADSEIARSENWEYIKPSKRLPTPTVPTWTNEFQIKLPAYEDPYKDNGGARFEILFSATQVDAVSADQLAQVGEGWKVSPGFAWDARPCVLPGKLTAGYYYARWRMSSIDITQCQNSDWSPLSTAYYYAGNDDQILSSGTMGGADKSLEWKYNELGQVSVSGDLAPGETVLAACYDESGRFTGLKVLDAEHTSAQLEADAPGVKLFWLDGGRKPLSSPAAVLDG